MERNSIVQFPGESAGYRAARNELLAAERELRRHVEQIAELRRKLPLGGELAEDYVFEEQPGDIMATATVVAVRFSDLFRPGLDTLALYNFMYGPRMKQACPMCTSFLDSLNGTAPHAAPRLNLAVVAKSPIERIREFARGRRWNHLRLLSSAPNTYNRDYHGETAEGSQLPVLSVFVRRDGKIFHSYSTELAFVPPEPGEDQRHIDMMWPLWNLLDLTPEGRGTDWYPRLTY